jgi:hypothetical protein
MRPMVHAPYLVVLSFGVWTLTDVRSADPKPRIILESGFVSLDDQVLKLKPEQWKG